MNEERIRQIFQEMYNSKTDSSQFNTVSIAAHKHTGNDSQRVSFSDLEDKTMALSYTLPGITAQTAGNYSSFFIVPSAMTVTQIQVVYTTTNGAALTLDVEKLSGTTAPGSGTKLTSTALNLNTTANTVYTGVLSTTVGITELAIGDRLALLKTGTLTSITNLTVTLILNF